MKVMLIGDTHGGNKHILPKLDIAHEAGIQNVVVLGDFGLWTHEFNGHAFLDAVQRGAEENNLSVFAVGGNHENWDHWQWYMDNMPTSKGWRYIRSRVLLAPKVHEFTWAHKKFLVAGGAVSVDKDVRLRSEAGDNHIYDQYMIKARGRGPHTEWWPDEQLTEADTQFIEQRVGKVDYLLTHDCSNRTPFKGRLKPDFDSQIHRTRIDRVLAATNPELHFHGHMHTKYDWMNRTSGDHYCQTYGLDCNDNSFSWGTLDVETGRFVWEDTKFR